MDDEHLDDMKVKNCNNMHFIATDKTFPPKGNIPVHGYRREWEHQHQGAN